MVLEWPIYHLRVLLGAMVLALVKGAHEGWAVSESRSATSNKDIAASHKAVESNATKKKLPKAEPALLKRGQLLFLLSFFFYV